MPSTGEQVQRRLLPDAAMKMAALVASCPLNSSAQQSICCLCWLYLAQVERIPGLHKEHTHAHAHSAQVNRDVVVLRNLLFESGCSLV